MATQPYTGSLEGFVPLEDVETAPAATATPDAEQLPLDLPMPDGVETTKPKKKKAGTGARLAGLGIQALTPLEMALGGLTSGFGAAPNPVSDYFMRGAQAAQSVGQDLAATPGQVGATEGALRGLTQLPLQATRVGAHVVGGLASLAGARQAADVAHQSGQAINEYSQQLAVRPDRYEDVASGVAGMSAQIAPLIAAAVAAGPLAAVAAGIGIPTLGKGLDLAEQGVSGPELYKTTAATGALNTAMMAVPMGIGAKAAEFLPASVRSEILRRGLGIAGGAAIQHPLNEPVRTAENVAVSEFADRPDLQTPELTGDAAKAQQITDMLMGGAFGYMGVQPKAAKPGVQPKAAKPGVVPPPAAEGSTEPGPATPVSPDVVTSWAASRIKDLEAKTGRREPDQPVLGPDGQPTGEVTPGQPNFKTITPEESAELTWLKDNADKPEVLVSRLASNDGGKLTLEAPTTEAAPEAAPPPKSPGIPAESTDRVDQATEFAQQLLDDGQMERSELTTRQVQRRFGLTQAEAKQVVTTLMKNGQPPERQTPPAPTRQEVRARPEQIPTKPLPPDVLPAEAPVTDVAPAEPAAEVQPSLAPDARALSVVPVASAEPAPLHPTWTKDFQPDAQKWRQPSPPEQQADGSTITDFYNDQSIGIRKTVKPNGAVEFRVRHDNPGMRPPSWLPVANDSTLLDGLVRPVPETPAPMTSAPEPVAKAKKTPAERRAAKAAEQKPNEAGWRTLKDQKGETVYQNDARGLLLKYNGLGEPTLYSPQDGKYLPAEVFGNPDLSGAPAFKVSMLPTEQARNKPAEAPEVNVDKVVQSLPALRAYDYAAAQEVKADRTQRGKTTVVVEHPTEPGRYAILSQAEYDAIAQSDKAHLVPQAQAPEAAEPAAAPIQQSTSAIEALAKDYTALPLQQAKGQLRMARRAGRDSVLVEDPTSPGTAYVVPKSAAVKAGASFRLSGPLMREGDLTPAQYDSMPSTHESLSPEINDVLHQLGVDVQGDEAKVVKLPNNGKFVPVKTFTNQLAQIFGTKYHFVVFKPGTPAERQFEGVYNGGDNVFVNLNSFDPVSTIWHETGHAMRRLMPEAWDLATRALGAVPRAEWMDHVAQRGWVGLKNREGKPLYNEDQLFEEYGNDRLAEAMTSKAGAYQFNRVLQRSGLLEQSALRQARDFIIDTWGRLKVHLSDDQRAKMNLQIVDDTVKAMEMFRQREQNPQAYGRTAMSLPPDVLTGQVTTPESVVQLYSKLYDGVSKLQLKKASGQQWINTIRNMRGLKSEELLKSGLENHLAFDDVKPDQVYTKEQVLQYLEENHVGGHPYALIHFNKNMSQDAAGMIDHLRNTTPELVDSWVRSMSSHYRSVPQIWEGGMRDAVWAVHRLYNGTSTNELADVNRVMANIEPTELQELVPDFMQHPNPSYQAHVLKGDYKNYTELVLATGGRHVSSSRSHFDPADAGNYTHPNPVYHIRTTERDLNGQRIMMVEEVQSDWNAAVRGGDMLIRTAPIEGYEEPALRAAAAYAAKNGYDGIALTTPEQQHLRYRNAGSAEKFGIIYGQKLPKILAKLGAGFKAEPTVEDFGGTAPDEPGKQLTLMFNDDAKSGLSRPQPLFSLRRPEETTNSRGVTFVRSLKNASKDVRDKAINFGYGLLGRRQIVELWSKDLKSLTDYDLAMEAYTNSKNTYLTDADELAKDWAVVNKDKRMGKMLTTLMHQATLEDVDPSQQFIEQNPGTKEDVYNRLALDFRQLTPEAQQVFLRSRDTYQDLWAQIYDIWQEKIDRAAMDDNTKLQMKRELQQSVLGQSKKIFFPLQHFGKYYVEVKGPNGRTLHTEFKETRAEADELRTKLVRQYGDNPDNLISNVQEREAFSIQRSGVSFDFVNKLNDLMKESFPQDPDIAAAMIDAINQMYLRSLPDNSFVRNALTQKDTPGYSEDARRAFAFNVMKGSGYINKLRYVDRIQRTLNDAQAEVRAKANDTTFDSVGAQKAMNELYARHKQAFTKETSPLSNLLTGVGFMFHLGLSPASALVNIAQTPLVAYPVLGARYGFDHAATELVRASKETVTSRNDLSTTLFGPEQLAMERAIRAGVVDLTLTHDLAKVAKGSDGGYSEFGRPAEVMNKASTVAAFMFHHAERFNRQATFLAAFRLAKRAGRNDNDAYNEAKKAVYDSHFDVSMENRPRYLSGNVTKVLFLFKTYAQNMAWALARGANGTYKTARGAATAEDKAYARQLAGMLTAHAVAAGVYGLPVVGTLLSIASQIGGTDDEPFDAKVALQNYVADATSPEAANVLFHGVTRAASVPLPDISSRVGLNTMFFQDGSDAATYQDAFTQAMMQGVGPVGGIALNYARGLDLMSQGETWRAVENFMTKAARDAMKSWRYTQEGVRDKTGVAVVPETTLPEELTQLIGFTPARVATAYEGLRARRDFDTKIMARRSELIKSYVEAAADKNDEGSNALLDQILTFNKLHPLVGISGQELTKQMTYDITRPLTADAGFAARPTRQMQAKPQGRFAELQSLVANQDPAATAATMEQNGYPETAKLLRDLGARQ